MHSPTAASASSLEAIDDAITRPVVPIVNDRTSLPARLGSRASPAS
jgi:hypothetical protein